MMGLNMTNPTNQVYLGDDGVEIDLSSREEIEGVLIC
jgi:hypothetical protein